MRTSRRWLRLHRRQVALLEWADARGLRVAMKLGPWLVHTSAWPAEVSVAGGEAR